MLKVALVLSLAINVGLFGYVFVSQDSASSASRDVKNISSDIDRKKSGATGIISDPIRLLTQLEGEYPTTRETTAIYYWESPSKLVSQLHEEQAQTARSIRAELLAAYGDAAISQPEFESYFFPLGSGFGFLNSEQHIQISELRGKHRSSLMSIKGGPQAFTELKQKELAYLESVQSRLSAEEFFEFELRESQTAKQLRSVDIDWTESEFLEVFKIKSASDQAGSPLQLINPDIYNLEVSEVLGSDRYMEYLKAADPMYTRLNAQIQRDGGSEQDAEKAYSIYVNYGAKISDAMQSKDLRAVQQLQKERSQIIQEKTGIRVGQPQQIPFDYPKKRWSDK